MPSLAAFVFISPLFLRAQKLDSMMNIYATNYQQEKIHVQFDKNIQPRRNHLVQSLYLFRAPILRYSAKTSTRSYRTRQGIFFNEKCTLYPNLPRPAILIFQRR